MDLIETTKQYNEIVNSIHSKYQEKMGKVTKLLEEIDNVPNKYIGNTQSFINSKIKQLREKVEIYKDHAENWLKVQMESADRWLNGHKSKIEKEVDRRASDALNSINAFINKKQ